MFASIKESRRGDRRQPGIGKGIAEVLAEQGVRVAVMARSRDAAQACADALVAAGGQARGYAADVGDRTSMDAAARAVARTMAASTSSAPTPASSPARRWKRSTGRPGTWC